MPTSEEIKKDILETANIVQETLQSVASQIGDIFRDALEEADSITKVFGKDIEKQLKSMSHSTERMVENSIKMKMGTASSKDIAKQLLEYTTKQEILQQRINNLQKNNPELYNQLQSQLNDVLEQNLDYIDALHIQDKLLKDQVKNMGAMGGALKATSKILQRFGIDSQIIDDMYQKLNEVAMDGKVTFRDYMSVMKEGLKKAWSDPIIRMTAGIALFRSGFNDLKKWFEIIKGYDTIFTETARNLGIGVFQSQKLIENSIQFEQKFGGNFYTAKQIGQAITDINTQLGLSVDLGASTVDEFAAMTNQMGLSTDEASKIYKLGVLNNLSLKDTNKAIASGIISAQKSTGIQINAKQVFQEIGKLSAGILIKFQQNPEALAKAVIQAKALGTTLDGIDKIGESLLNWESSIENELKAELITGRQLNFERARYAALTGDMVSLTKEVANQVGSLSEFENMNVIAQRSLAESFGLSRDELSDMLQKQEVFNKLGDVSKLSAREQLKLAKERNLPETDSLMINLKQQAAAETLAATWDSIKMSMAGILEGPLKGLVNMMGWLAKHATIAKIAIGAIAVLSLAKTIGGLTLMAIQLGASAAGAIGTASAITLGIGAVAIIAGMAAMMASYDNAKSEAIKPSSNIPFAKGGIVTSEINNATIGEAGAEAIIPLNSPKADNILGGKIDLTPLISAINEVKNAVNNMKPGHIYMNTEKVGMIIGKEKSTGTEIYKGSYKLA